MASLALAMLLQSKGAKKAARNSTKVGGKLAEGIAQVLHTSSLRNLSLPPAMQAKATDLVPASLLKQKGKGQGKGTSPHEVAAASDLPAAGPASVPPP
jgi:hypothetical protein